MAIFRSIVFSAALAGLIVGLFVTLAQRVGTVPLILQAEVYERQAEAAEREHAAAATPAPTPTAPMAMSGHDHAAHAPAMPEGEAAAWEPAEGFERTAYTALFNVVEWIGFGLLLNGAFALLRGPVSWRVGFLWGLGGFAALVVAPGLGLPPELPGIPAADLAGRQIWWVGAAAATAAGLALIALRRAPWAAVVGVALIVAPHLIGAPQLDAVETNVPEALSHRFIVAVTLTGLACWALLGGLTGHFYRRFSAAA